MTLVSFAIFKDKINELRKKVEEWKSDHKMASEAVSIVIASLPQPFDKFFGVVWNDLEKQNRDNSAQKLIALIEKFESINEESFRAINSKLDRLLESQISDEDIRNLGDQIQNSNKDIVFVLSENTERIANEIRRAQTKAVEEKRTLSENVNVSDKVTVNKANNARNALFNNLLNLLQSGNVNEFNKVWEINGKPSLDFSGKDFSGLNLDKINLPLFILERCNFSKCSMKEANLQATNLRRSRLDDAYLRGADLRGADLEEVSAREINLMHANMEDTKLTRARLDGASIDSAKAAGAFLHEASMVRATLIGTNLDNASLEYADLSYADLSRCSLINANLSECKLNSTKLLEANIFGAVYLPISIDEAKARGAIVEERLSVKPPSADTSYKAS